MTALRAHCPRCGHMLRTVLGMALIDGVILTKGRHRASLGPVQAAIPAGDCPDRRAEQEVSPANTG